MNSSLYLPLPLKGRNFMEPAGIASGIFIDSPLKNSSLYLFFFLEDIRKKKTQQFLHLVCESLPLAAWLNLHLAVFTATPEKELIQFRTQLPLALPVYSDEGEISRCFSCRKSKEVFGQRKEVFVPVLLLADGERVVSSARQAGPAALRRLFGEAAHLQFSRTKQAINSLFDKNCPG